MALRMRAAAAAVCVESSRGRNPRFLSLYPHLGPKFPSSASPSFDRRISSHPQKQVGSVYEKCDKSFATFKHRIRAINTEAEVEPKASSVKEDEKLSDNWKIKMLYDGECPLCMREVNMLSERNKLYGTIKFVDISSDEYSAEENQGIDYKTAMGRIHAIESDGTIVTDVEAFRRLYEEVGLGWVYAVTKYKPIAVIANAVYAVWAKYRMQITGRPSLEDVLEARMKNKGEVCNDSKACKM
ncbi:putative thiol-disulfide oxidoreductase DCC [Macleaya cordata]|uniref:Putative thiol-disulfide oxidoreductase DCC n=1 Tax=Macleaya cordata TaxID=56857 RepID=A0A200QLH1_MACCD|nr:putative thiol-disulfide oxidoreductase DCC [Macleaya cordata]